MLRVCGGHLALSISKLIAERLIPRKYAHRNAYGNHKELIRAKYFADEFITHQTVPLQTSSFAEQIGNVTNVPSIEIWQLLTEKFLSVGVSLSTMCSYLKI